MSVSLLLLFEFLVGLLAKICNKLCSNGVMHSGKAGMPLFLIINGAVACVFFAVSSGLNLKINLLTAIFSFAYAVIVVLALVSNLVALQIADIASITLISSACSIIAACAVGCIGFGESIGLKEALRIFAMLTATFLVFLGMKKQGTKVSKGNMTAFLAITALMAIVACGKTVTLKLYALSDNVADNNSFFFYTNVFTILIALLWLTYFCFKDRKEIKKSLDFLKPLSTLCTVGNTVCSNISSLIGILLIEKLAITVYTPLTSALGLICGVTASIIFFEKLNRYKITAVLFAVAAVIL